MATIIAARVETQQRADELMAQLQARGIRSDDMQAFYVNPPGQHGTYPIGGDMDADTGTEESKLGAGIRRRSRCCSRARRGRDRRCCDTSTGTDYRCRNGRGRSPCRWHGRCARIDADRARREARNRNTGARRRCGRHASRWNDPRGACGSAQRKNRDRPASGRWRGRSGTRAR